MTEDEQPAGMPGWVKAFVAVAIVLAALAVVSLLTGGEHGPGRHGIGVAAS